MPAIRPASAKRQAKRQSPTRSRTMRRYLRRGAAERPRIAADARDLHRGRRIVRRTFGARSDHPALRARPRRGSVSGRRSVLGGTLAAALLSLPSWLLLDLFGPPS